MLIQEIATFCFNESKVVPEAVPETKSESVFDITETKVFTYIRHIIMTYAKTKYQRRVKTCQYNTISSNTVSNALNGIHTGGSSPLYKERERVPYTWPVMKSGHDSLFLSASMTAWKTFI